MTGLVFAVLWGTAPLMVMAQNSPADSTTPADAAQNDASQKKLDLAFKRQKIELILASIQAQTGVKVIAQGKTAGQAMDIIVQGVTVEEALNQIIAGKDWLWRKDPETGNYEIWDKPSFKTQVLPTLVKQRTYQLDHVPAEEAAKSIRGVLTKDIGNLAVEPRTNKLIITDLPQVLELIERLLDEIDVDLIMRVFYIRHADVGTVADKLKLYKSAPGSIEVDERTHQIIVEDNINAIQQMEMLVQILDIGPEMKVYDVNNVGVDSKGLDELRAAIERLITKDAFFEINSIQGNFILEDVPEVHEKVEKLLQAFDKTPKQVFIEAEVLDVQFVHSFNWTLNYQFSEDLFSAYRDGLLENTEGRNIFDPGSGDITQDLGFLNIGEEFPAFRVGGGIVAEYLDDNIHALLSTSLQDNNTRILLQPRIPVKNQEDAELFVGSEEPFLTTLFSTTNVNNINSLTQQTLTAGLRIKIKPTITNNGLIELKIDVSNDRAKTVTRTYQDQTYDLVGRDRQNATTTMIVPSGSTRVLAGLTTDQRTNSEAGIPLLMKIPVIGRFLFGNVSESTRQSNIMFFITPSILEEKAPFARRIDKARKITEIVPEEILRKDEITTSAEALLAHYRQPGAQPLSLEDRLKNLMEAEGRPLTIVSEPEQRIKEELQIMGTAASPGGTELSPATGEQPAISQEELEKEAQEAGQKEQEPGEEVSPPDQQEPPIPIKPERENVLPEGTETDY
ncbi:MAG: hypothetical protein Kow0059_09570 [Candidatus Sumerlaeia bacterium]